MTNQIAETAGVSLFFYTNLRLKRDASKEMCEPLRHVLKVR
jgi:hypothetical protein